MNWKNDISNLAHVWMNFLGQFSPTVMAKDRTVKGCMLCDSGEEGSVYLDSGELRELARACNEVADWLDKRAVEEGNGN